MAMNIPTFDAVEATAAPKPVASNKNTDAVKEQNAFDGFVKSLKPGMVGKLPVSAENNFRSLAMRVRRAAKRTGIELGTVWEADGFCWFNLKAAPAAPKAA